MLSLLITLLHDAVDAYGGTIADSGALSTTACAEYSGIAEVAVLLSKHGVRWGRKCGVMADSEVCSDDGDAAAGVDFGLGVSRFLAV